MVAGVAGQSPYPPSVYILVPSRPRLKTQKMPCRETIRREICAAEAIVAEAMDIICPAPAPCTAMAHKCLIYMSVSLYHPQNAATRALSLVPCALSSSQRNIGYRGFIWGLHVCSTCARALVEHDTQRVGTREARAGSEVQDGNPHKKREAMYDICWPFSTSCCCYPRPLSPLRCCCCGGVAGAPASWRVVVHFPQRPTPAKPTTDPLLMRTSAGHSALTGGDEAATGGDRA